MNAIERENHLSIIPLKVFRKQKQIEALWNDTVLFDGVFKLNQGVDTAELIKHGVVVAKVEYLPFFNSWYVFAVKQGQVDYIHHIEKHVERNKAIASVWLSRGTFTINGNIKQNEVI